MSTVSSPGLGTSPSRGATYRREAARLAGERGRWRAVTWAGFAGLLVALLAHVVARLASCEAPREWRMGGAVIGGLGAVVLYLAGRRRDACRQAGAELAQRWVADVVALAGGAPLPEGWELDELPVLVDHDEDRARLLEELEQTPAGPRKLRAALAAIGADE